jgi:catechol 1,2-dioxygenase
LLVLSGVVRAADCVTPLAGALVDIWQANADGAYDGVGYTLRGRLRTDDQGRYELLTLVPGRYLNGDTYRPAHIHYQVSHARAVPLTTQLYFEGDPFNAIDPFITDSLIMPLVAEREAGAAVYRTRFDVALAEA